ncbi:MAG: hypothetical protein QGI60_05595 [archaeon]|jgi:hypothetical protein|nr:hypothetical protein [archaeon]
MTRSRGIRQRPKHAKIVQERVRLINAAFKQPENLQGPGRLEARTAGVTTLSAGEVRSTLLKHPELRVSFNKQQNRWIMIQIDEARKAGYITIRGISEITGLTQNKISRVIKASTRGATNPAGLGSATKRRNIGKRRGHKTKIARSVTNLVSAADKKPASLSALAGMADMSKSGLDKLRKTQPIVDAIALEILARGRKLTRTERKRLAEGKKELEIYLSQRISQEETQLI